MQQQQNDVSSSLRTLGMSPVILKMPRHKIPSLKMTRMDMFCLDRWIMMSQVMLKMPRPKTLRLKKITRKYLFCLKSWNMMK
ncbi:hypothetical protein ACB092_09G168200 [Castanea dentata]